MENEIEQKMMSPEEARKRVTVINSSINNLRFLVLDFHDREGWRALGYDSFTACAEKEFDQGRRQIFRQLAAAQIEQNINQASEKLNEIAESKCQDDTKPIPEAQLRPLATVPKEEQATVYKLAKETAPGGKVTAAHVEKIVREIKGEKPKRVLTGINEENPRPIMAHIPPSNIEQTIDTILYYIDTIKDTDPGCKAALAKIANHVWQRINKKNPAAVPKE